jgi:hypothetical protein
MFGTDEPPAYLSVPINGPPDVYIMLPGNQVVSSSQNNKKNLSFFKKNVQILYIPIFLQIKFLFSFQQVYFLQVLKLWMYADDKRLGLGIKSSTDHELLQNVLNNIYPHKNINVKKKSQVPIQKCRPIKVVRSENKAKSAFPVFRVCWKCWISIPSTFSQFQLGNVFLLFSC